MEIGQEVAVVRHSFHAGTRASFGWKVKNISPAKNIVTVVKDGMGTLKFDSRGWEIGGERALNENVEAIREQIERERRMADAAAAIMAVRVTTCLPTYIPESMIKLIHELEGKLAIAKAKVEAL